MTKSLNLLVLLILTASAHGQTAMIYDDDGPVQDVGAVQNFGVFYKMVDNHWIKPLATIADSGNSLSAPGIHALAVYYGQTDIPIGANQQNTPDSAGCKLSNCIANDWNAGWVAEFDPVSGDTRTNYQDCGALYRKTLAAQPHHSVVIVETGFATCLMQLLNSSADALSPLTGAQLVKEKVKSLVVMGGDYPTGAEWNFQMDSSNYAALFSIWKTPNGYPPIYLVGDAIGYIACSGAPANASLHKNPIRNANVAANAYFAATQPDPVLAAAKPDPVCASKEMRPVWDELAIMYGAWGASYGGTTYFEISPGGTNTVDHLNGTNLWDPSTNSGHYYLIAKASQRAFAGFLDGYTYAGLLAEPPGVVSAK